MHNESGLILARQASRRRGIATLWTILFSGAMLLMLCFVVEIAHLWLTRVELENSLEAAALAAVKEWGDADGGSTLIPRYVGIDYAAANTLDDDPVAITTNYDPDNLPNENDDCEGNLVFGAITEDSTMYVFDEQVTFNAGIRPTCGLGSVLIDATGQGNLGDDAAWGVAFRDTAETPPNLTILSITIDLQAGGGSGRFDFTSFPPVLSDNLPEPMIPGRDDIIGFSDPSAQIVFSPTSGMPSALTIFFLPDPGLGGDLGFEPGDRFRFGAFVDGVSKGTGGDDGDGIGQDDVEVTVVFALGGVPLPPVSGTFFDNKERSNDCYPEHPVHPTEIPDLPCPPSSAPNNNGQSYVGVAGAARSYAVRAQSTAAVNSLFCQLCGVTFGPFSVSAKSTAVYDCAIRRPRLIRIDEFICPGP
ncbi:MAG: Tad domain-containing protein [Thermoguttaceae bacterium]